MPSPQSKRPKGMADKYPPHKRAELFTFLAHNDNNKAKASRDLKIPLRTVKSLIARYPEEHSNQDREVKRSIIQQAIEDRKMFMDVLREAIKTQLEMLGSDKDRRCVRPSEIARAFDVIDKFIKGGDDKDAGQETADNREDEAEVSKQIDAFLEREPTKNTES
jgi:hypothetical protein